MEITIDLYESIFVLVKVILLFFAGWNIGDAITATYRGQYAKASTHLGWSIVSFIIIMYFFIAK